MELSQYEIIEGEICRSPFQKVFELIFEHYCKKKPDKYTKHTVEEMQMHFFR